MTSPSSSKSLIAKLCEVMTAVDHVEKKGRNRDQNYDFARDVDVSTALRTELSSRKVFLCTSVTHVDTEIYTTKSGSRGAINTVYTAHKFIDGESGEILEFTWASQGMDGQDKGVSKGATSAIKYALLKQFLIPTGDDPDEGTKPADRPVAPRARTEPPAPPARQEQAPATTAPTGPLRYEQMTPKNATDVARRWFFAKLKEDHGMTAEQAKGLLDIESFTDSYGDQTFAQILYFVGVAKAKRDKATG